MSVDNKMIEIAVASLLHDIGKVYERTNKKIENREEQFRYSHASYTSEFFNEWNGLNIKDIDTGNIEAIASYHHNPNDDPLHFIVQQADRYSAGSDRRDKDQKEQITKGKSKRPLLSIFSQLKINDDNPSSDAKSAQYSLSGEKGLEVGFPNDENTVSEQAYRELYKKLKEDLNKLNNCNKKLIVDNLIGICRKHMSLVTSSAVSAERSDITLFDHSLTTAAISCAMYGWHKENGQFKDTEIQNHSINKFLLFKVDLSGIQNFILDLPKQNQKGIAKILRARSSYLSILMMGLSRLLLEKLGLPSTNCLLNAGGNFTVLAQNTEKTKKQILDFQEQLDDWMLKTFNGKLNVNISEPIEFCGSDFSVHNNFKNLSLKVSEKIDKAKKQRLKSVLQDNGKWNEDNHLLEIKYDQQGNDELNEKMKILGGKLAYVNYIIFNETDDTSNSDDLDIMGRLQIEISKNAKLFDNTLMALSVNSSDYQTGFAPISLANYVPKANKDDVEKYDELESDDEGQVLMFNCIADKSDGKKALAVLKADVDRLGMLFSEGLVEKNYTISRIATLSRMLDGFFTSYLNLLLHEKYPYIYTEYAGGDDLVLIGPWDRIMDLAVEMRQSFKKYTCNNPDINISAGISLMHVGEPVTNALRQAENLLEMAKESGRNRISVFGITLDWDTYAQAIENGKWLKKNNEDNEINSGFIYRLLLYYQMNRRVKKEGSLKDAKWRSQLSYDMSRNIKNDTIRQNVEKMISGENLDNFKVASTFCLYALRD